MSLSALVIRQHFALFSDIAALSPTELRRILHHHLAHRDLIDPSFDLEDFVVCLHAELPELLTHGENKVVNVALTLRDALKFCEALHSLRARCLTIAQRPNGPKILACHAALLVFSEAQPSRSVREAITTYILASLGVTQEELVNLGNGPLGPLEMHASVMGEMLPRMTGSPSPFAYTKYSSGRLQKLAMMAATGRLVVLDGVYAWMHA